MDAVVLTRAQWQQRAAAHERRADELTAAYRQAHAAGRKHAIDDFLFTYYAFKPQLLRRWHPGAGILLAEAPEFAAQRWYRDDEDGRVGFDADAWLAERGELARRILALNTAIAGRPARFGCFGLHEWAMVYREREHRHPLPLRLGQEGTDAVVEANPITCTHFDAFRFFTPEARPRNATQPSRATQIDLDQSGCLHANMDIYKWCMKLGPLVPGELTLDAFALAREVRWLDMRASPYDVSGFGVAPVCIETADGKREYAAAQREFAARAAALRERLLACLRRSILCVAADVIAGC